MSKTDKYKAKCSKFIERLFTEDNEPSTSNRYELVRMDLGGMVMYMGIRVYQSTLGRPCSFMENIMVNPEEQKVYVDFFQTGDPFSSRICIIDYAEFDQLAMPDP